MRPESRRQNTRLHPPIPPRGALLVIIFRLTTPSSTKMSGRFLLTLVVLLFVFVVSSQQELFDLDEQNGVDDSSESVADYYAVLPITPG